MKNALNCIEINSSRPSVGTVIWLHGLGADGYDFVPIANELNAFTQIPLRFVFPHAPMIPVTLNNGYVMRAWYDIVSLQIEQHADQTGIENSVQLVGELIAREEKKGVMANKIILAGFSQGAVIALTAGLSFPKRLAGVIALSGYLPKIALTNAHPANQDMPIFVGHGSQDTIVPHSLGDATYQALHAHHYSVSWHSYPMPHSVCAAEIQDIAKWVGTAINRP